MKELLTGILLLALLPWTVNGAAQEPQVSFFPLVFAPSWLNQMELAFVSAQDGDPEIYVMKGDGSGRRQLTFNSAPEGWPAYLATDDSPDWSPGGQMLAFVFTTGDRFAGFIAHIGLITSDGTFYKEITGPEDQGYQPDWSPVTSAP